MTPVGEVPLPGGTANRGRVIRVGDTVHRPRRATGAATRALLDHLAGVGFDGAPRWLGIDDEGREMLSFVHGRAPIAPYPDWALGEDALVSVAVLLRRFHDAVDGFPAREWRWHRCVPAPFRTGMASHNDPNLDNVVFRDGAAVALIDFDLAGSGSRLWDLAMAARLWCPLRDEDDVPDRRHGHGLRRLSLFLDAYEAASGDRDRFVDAALASHRWAYDHVRSEVALGHEAFTEHWVTRRAAERSHRTWTWMQRRRAELARAAGAAR